MEICKTHPTAAKFVDVVYMYFTSVTTNVRPVKVIGTNQDNIELLLLHDVKNRKARTKSNGSLAMGSPFVSSMLSLKSNEFLNLLSHLQLVYLQKFFGISFPQRSLRYGIKMNTIFIRCQIICWYRKAISIVFRNIPNN